MKRHQRKPVLDLNSDSSRKKQNKYHQNNEQILNHDNGTIPSNPLSNLLEQYNSDSDGDEDSKHNVTDNSGRQLDKKVDDFLKEIQYINPNTTTPVDQRTSDRPINIDKENSVVQEDSSPWQECFDESTGYPYYWHIETNQVTWEIPKELELSKKKIDQVNSPRPVFDPQRNFTSKTYPQMQSNIPEGMIPKEVVARNRNRQVNLPSTSKITSTNDKDNKTLNDSKDDDINDGKIEMITSFGSDGSDESDESVDDDVNSKEKIISTVLPCTTVDSKPKKRKRMQKIGPKLPENNYDTIANGHDDNPNEPSIENDEKSNESLEQNVDDKEHKFSLVPGYADDSDNEDDHSNNKPSSQQQQQQVSTLFPISNYQEKELKTFTNIEKTELQQNIDSVDSCSADDNNSGTIKPEELNVTKVNIFLENNEAPAKRYQRKQRIAFDLMPNTNKITENENNCLEHSNSNSNSNSSINKSDLIRSNDERLGFGFPKRPSTPDTTNNKPSSSIEERSTDSSIDKQDSSINFVRGETINISKNINSNNEEDDDDDDDDDKNDESDRIETKNETKMILEKLKFLSEGCQVASAVQVMTIQLQTLLGAWESGDLKNQYLDNWLKGTSQELGRLETAAAPSGWECKWDRSYKRYFYRNESTGEVQWNYPDVIGGAEEMELCTTPPPQDEEAFIDDKSCSNLMQQEVSENTVDKKQDNKLTNELENLVNKQLDHNNKTTPTTTTTDMDTNKDDNCDVKNDGLVAPPPPQISSPSPPPPPKIFPDDLKHGKKRRVNEFDSSSMISTKKEKISTDVDQSLRVEETVKNIQQTLSSHSLVGPVHAEPLPPGVDSPEISYPLAGTPLEQTVIFTTTPHQQTNASLYAAAALQDPTLMGHHHQALLQSQLVHYPAYHQHLHNQAILAAANRLNNQETVQFVLDFPRIYTNTQVIAKPPMKTSNETMGSALDSFYSDIASLERPPIEAKPVEAIIYNTNLPDRPQPVSTPTSLTSDNNDKIINDALTKDKEKKKKKAKIVISKKHKQVSSMVAKWQKAQNYEDSS
ncbi:uncharacterized protein LOC122853418 isoform X2 [Aphidius gifuensis]|uniref:uncharacterized protein LOC122853418 isoform X2 n=1 Tax=Aphidius gifuensis TaxID=684658 RepID=UPI001CDD588F|nr:uncharacterized protein LOC122853418 isoform X2 [Aphidius gifuensis]